MNSIRVSVRFDDGQRQGRKHVRDFAVDNGSSCGDRANSLRLAQRVGNVAFARACGVGNRPNIGLASERRKGRQIDRAFCRCNCGLTTNRAIRFSSSESVALVSKSGSESAPLPVFIFSGYWAE